LRLHSGLQGKSSSISGTGKIVFAELDVCSSHATKTVHFAREGLRNRQHCHLYIHQGTIKLQILTNAGFKPTPVETSNNLSKKN
jgi:hypothetical protein